MKVERIHVSGSDAGTKVGASKFSGSSMVAGGIGRFNRKVPGTA